MLEIMLQAGLIRVLECEVIVVMYALQLVDQG